ncbi:MAG: amino acid permease [Deltaproteobacteria bacterium]|nr:amino acid permease [Deltaproteobacteria bacterium]
MSFIKDVFYRKPIDKIISESENSERSLKRVLNASDLILLGIGAIVGAGIFATVGTAAVGDIVRPGAGPALIISFILTAIACGFAALCYAELASMVPISGSAYTYAYATLGQVVAWIIGWDLIIEYAVGNVAVAISWSGYFKELMSGLGVKIPEWLTTDYRSAFSGSRIYEAASLLAGGNSMEEVKTLYPKAAEYISEQLSSGQTLDFILSSFQHARNAVIDSPRIFSLPIIFNLPAVMIVLLITVILVIGIKESSYFNAVMVGVKLLVLGLFIVVGLFYVRPENWTPFAPNGWAGIHAGAAIVFFAYIGFDAVSTAAEETVNPARNLPIGIIGSLIICTIIYILVAAVLTGMVPLSVFTQSNKAEPLTVAMNYHRLNWIAGIISFGSIVAHTAVLLVFQLGQPRIFFSMARDGLLPRSFAKVHKRFRTPYVTTILTGVFVAFFSAFTNIDEMVDLTNIGTLFAFIIVCLGVIILRIKEPNRQGGFKTPFFPLIPILGILSCIYLMLGLPKITYIRFAIWLLIGLLIYVIYGYRNVKLITREEK